LVEVAPASPYRCNDPADPDFAHNKNIYGEDSYYSTIEDKRALVDGIAMKSGG
jgi:hypothetical protein